MQPARRRRGGTRGRPWCSCPWCRVTPITPAPPRSASHSAVAVVTGTPLSRSAAARAGGSRRRASERARSQPASGATASPAAAIRAPGAPSSARRVGRRRAVEDRHRDPRRGQAPRELRGERGDLAAGAPHADARAVKLREAHARAAAAPRERSGRCRGRARRPGSPADGGVRGSTSAARRRTTRVGGPARVASASMRIAARLSCSSPTHSNGLWPPPVAVSSAKPSNWSSSASRSRPKISRRCAGALKGASARNTKRHFGHSQHHDAARSEGSMRKHGVAARERRVVGLHAGERARNRQLRRGAQDREQSGASGRSRRAPRAAGARPQALAELVVDLDPVPDEVAARGRALVGHGHRVEAVQRGGQQRHAGDDRGDRHVAVERARAVQRRQAGVQAPAGQQVRQLGDGDRAGDRGGVADREQRELTRGAADRSRAPRRSPCPRRPARAPACGGAARERAWAGGRARRRRGKRGRGSAARAFV